MTATRPDLRGRRCSSSQETLEGLFIRLCFNRPKCCKLFSALNFAYTMSSSRSATASASDVRARVRQFFAVRRNRVVAFLLLILIVFVLFVIFNWNQEWTGFGEHLGLNKTV